MPNQTKPVANTDRRPFIVLLVGALIGLLASFVLSYEALELARNAGKLLPCDLNSVVSCSTVAQHWSANLLGFPNAFVGMIAMPVFITIAVAGLAGVVFPQWFMRGAQGGASIAALFAIWMFYMSFNVIGALCPWCLTLDFGMILVFFAISRYNVRHGNCFASGRALEVMQSWVDKGYDVVAAVVLIVAVVAAIIIKYGGSLF